MAATRELRRRIRSVKNTAQITRAMQMVAATKMRRAQMQALAGRPYAKILEESLSRLLPKVAREENPLLQVGLGTTTSVIVLSTDKPLCGALNTNLFRAISLSNLGNTDYYTVGTKGRNFIVRVGKKLVADFENPETASFKTAKELAKLLIDAHTGGFLKEAYLAYPHFVSTLRQEPIVEKILPIEPKVLEGAKNDQEFLFEPDPARLLLEVLTHYLEIKIYQSMLEAKASEHSARMIAMQNATDNANELVDDLTLSYNQIRQDSITREILEIASASAAME